MNHQVLVEKGTRQDKEEFIHFINYVFGMNGVDQSFLKVHPKLYGPDTSPAEQNYIIRENGQIRAAVGVFPLPTIINGQAVNVQGIGNVAVHPASRGKGYMKAAMHQAIADMCAQDVDYIVLGGRRLRYAHFGFEICGSTLHMHIDRTNLSYVAPGRGTRLHKVLLEEENTAAISKLHQWMSEQNTYRCIREENRLYDILRTWEAQCWLFLREDETLAGYAVVEGHRVSELFVENTEEIHDILYLILEDGGYEVLVPLFDEELAAALHPYSEFVKMSAQENYCVLNYQKVLDLLMQVKAGYTGLPDGALRVRIHGLKSVENLCIQVLDGVPSVAECAGEDVEVELTHQEAMQMFFQIYAPNRSRLSAGAAAWFPLPIWQSPVDGV